MPMRIFPVLVYNTRQDFLGALPKGAICAEVGVFHGRNARNIIDICQPKTLFLIDMWQTINKKGSQKIHPDEVWEQYYCDICKLAVDNPSVKVLRMDSCKASKLFPDHYFDWIYIDAGHAYEDVTADLNCWSWKVKDNGLLCGHDYTDNEMTKQKGFGVKRAVDDFLFKTESKIEFISGESKATDYAIRIRPL